QDAAATYKRIVDESRGGTREQELDRARALWYEGFVAEAIDRFVRTEAMDSSGTRHAGFLTGEDLASWRATFEPPVSLEYRGHSVFKTGHWGGRRADSCERRHRPSRRRRPVREHRVGDPERGLAVELARRSGPRLPARHARADVLAGGRAPELARAAEAPTHDALTVARLSQRRSVPRLRDAWRRSTGPMVARRLPPPCRLRPRPAGRDRCAVVSHEPLPELVLSAGRASARDRGRGAVRTGRHR